MKFKTLMILSCIMLGSAPTLVAETGQIGVHGSLGFASATEIESTKQAGFEQSARRGLMFGASAEMGFTPSFYLAPEINYVQRGTVLSIARNGTTASLNLDMDYLAIPLFAKFKLNSLGIFRPYLYAGPEVAFKLNSKANLGVTSGDSSARLGNVNFSQDVNPVTLSAVAGVGAEFRVAERVSLFGDVRYTLGLTNAIDEKHLGTAVKLSSFQILGGLKFAL